MHDPLTCPICLDRLQDPFVTTCGHSYCHSCISCHLKQSNACPTCQQPLSDALIFPNVNLQQVLVKDMQDSQDRKRIKLCAELLGLDHVHLLNSQDPMDMIKTLQSCKEQKEREGKEFQVQLVTEFLKDLHVRKLKEMERLKKEIGMIETDMQVIQNEYPEKELLTQPEDSLLQVPEQSKMSQKSSVDPLVWTESTRTLSLHQEDLESFYFESHPLENESCSNRTPGFIMDFSSQISKMTQYKKFRTLASIRHANNSPRTGLSNSIVSAIDFDKDGELFATAGVSKVIQIYQLSNVIETSKMNHPISSVESSSRTQSSLSSAIFVDESESEQENFDPDEHTSIAAIIQREETPQQYPIIELKTSAKISSMSWNRYILPHLISSDYEGAITLWDVSQSKQLCRFSEHERRTWSCHFNPINPTMFASGGDDSKVKIWSTQQSKSTHTIHTKANVCSVKFNPTKSYEIAFGSADHHIYYYDLRYPQKPKKILKGHPKAVSYVDFTNEDRIISASTDCTLRSWDLNNGVEERCYRGHYNEKNFVGLAVHSEGDFYACGSENNCVYLYFKACRQPLLIYDFGGGTNIVDGTSLKKEPGHFVSSLAWKRQSNILVCANSVGKVQVLELV